MNNTCALLAVRSPCELRRAVLASGVGGFVPGMGLVESRRRGAKS